MTFDTTIGLGSLLVIATMVIGGLGAWFTLKAEYKDSAKRVAVLEGRTDGIERELSAHKLHISESYVKRDDLKSLEDRLGKLLDGMINGVGKRMDVVEHQLRNIDTRIMSVLNIKARERE